MAETRLLVLRTHQALWSKKRGYGLKEDGTVIEFGPPAGVSATMYFGGLMDRTKAALSEGHCFGTSIDDQQVGRQVATPLKPEEARRLFQTAIWSGSDSYPSAMSAEDMQLIARAGRSF